MCASRETLCKVPNASGREGNQTSSVVSRIDRVGEVYSIDRIAAASITRGGEPAAEDASPFAAGRWGWRETDMPRPSWIVIDSDTGQPMRWHALSAPLRAWAWFMNLGEGRERYYVTTMN